MGGNAACTGQRWPWPIPRRSDTVQLDQWKAMGGGQRVPPIPMPATLEFSLESKIALTVRKPSPTPVIWCRQARHLCLKHRSTWRDASRATGDAQVSYD